MDDEPVGGVRPRKMLRTAIAPGTHLVQARIDSAGSRKYRFTASPGQEYVFEVRPNGSVLTALSQALGSGYIRLTPTGSNVNGDWDQEVDRTPIVSVRALLLSGLAPGLLGTIGGLFGATASQRWLGVSVGLFATLLWTWLVRSGKLRPKRRNTSPPNRHNLARLVLILLGALIASLVLSAHSPFVFGVGMFFSCYVLATIISLYLQKWRRLASARAR